MPQGIPNNKTFSIIVLTGVVVSLYLHFGRLFNDNLRIPTRRRNSVCFVVAVWVLAMSLNGEREIPIIAGGV